MKGSPLPDIEEGSLGPSALRGIDSEDEAVMLFELDEMEEDPQPPVPAYITLTPRNADDRVRTLSKATYRREIRYNDLPSRDYMLQMADCQLRFSSFPNKAQLPTIDEMEEGVDRYSAFPRYLLWKGGYVIAQERMDTAFHEYEVCSHLARVELYNLPQGTRRITGRTRLLVGTTSTMIAADFSYRF
ncbi:hypothetical protein EON65_17785 [archaeon]|nr:MAG: hypothetical protein EON65_17785 [archaeon]